MEKEIRQNTLIVVDEDAATRLKVSNLLGKVFRILTTSEPSEAIHWVESDRSVKVIIVDQMLRRVSGLEILEQVRQLRPNIRRILITHYDDLASIVKALHSDAVNRTISKPVERTELVAALTFAVEQAAV